MTNFRSTRRSILAAGLTGAVSAVFPFTTHAHRQKQIHSSIEWNAGSSMIEITHRLHMHDAERALALLGKLDRPDLSSLKARALLALQVEQQFELNGLESDTIQLSILGAEIEGPHIYVYQEGPVLQKPAGVIIGNSILQDVYPDQINHVNIDLSGTVKTAIFSFGDKAKKVLA